MYMAPVSILFSTVSLNLETLASCIRCQKDLQGECSTLSNFFSVSSQHFDSVLEANILTTKTMITTNTSAYTINCIPSISNLFAYRFADTVSSPYLCGPTIYECGMAAENCIIIFIIFNPPRILFR
jgi:hypothetical protein